MTRHGTTRRRAVTLLEIVLALGLLVMLSGLTYWFYSAALASREAGITEVQRLQLARSVLERMATEIRQVVGETSTRDVSIHGAPESISILAVRQPATEMGRWRAVASDAAEALGEYDLHKVEYKIARHPEVIHTDGYEMPLGISLKDTLVPRKDSAEAGAALEGGPGGGGLSGFGNPGDAAGGAGAEEDGEAALAADEEDPRPQAADDADPLSKIHWEELYAPEIRYMRLCYFDGKKWWNDWDIAGDRPLPQLVQITIGFEPHAPYGMKLGLDEAEEAIVDRVCDCMNEDPSDCEPQPADQFTMTVRLEQADMFFRSRITRESQELVKELTGP